MARFVDAEPLGETVISYAHTIKIRALARLGELLRGLEKHPGGAGRRKGGGRKRGSKREPLFGTPPTLAELGVSKKAASIAQQLASLPHDTREAIAQRETTIPEVRRQRLTPCQAAACVVEFEELIAQFATEAATKQRTGKGPSGSGGRGKKKTIPPRDGKVSHRAPTTASKLAKQAGISARSVERAQALKKLAPDKLKAVKDWTLTLSQAGDIQPEQVLRKTSADPYTHAVSVSVAACSTVGTDAARDVDTAAVADGCALS